MLFQRAYIVFVLTETETPKRGENNCCLEKKKKETITTTKNKSMQLSHKP